MPSRIQMTVRVVANPWCSLDHEGRPAGHCARERLMSTTPGTHQGYVGAQCLATEPEKLPAGHQGTPSQDTVWHFTREVQALADPSGYYRKMVAAGDLIAADQKTAALSGVAWMPVEQALEEARRRAVAKFRAAFSEEPPAVDPYARPVPGRMPGDDASSGVGLGETIREVQGNATVTASATLDETPTTQKPEKGKGK